MSYVQEYADTVFTDLVQVDNRIRNTGLSNMFVYSVCDQTNRVFRAYFSQELDEYWQGVLSAVVAEPVVETTYYGDIRTILSTHQSIATTEWSMICKWYYGGTSTQNIGKVSLQAYSTGGEYQIRLYDVTNNVVLASYEGNNANLQVIDMIIDQSLLPMDNTTIEVQGKVSDAQSIMSVNNFSIHEIIC